MSRESITRWLTLGGYGLLGACGWFQVASIARRGSAAGLSLTFLLLYVLGLSLVQAAIERQGLNIWFRLGNAAGLAAFLVMTGLALGFGGWSWL